MLLLLARNPPPSGAAAVVDHTFPASVFREYQRANRIPRMNSGEHRGNKRRTNGRLIYCGSFHPRMNTMGITIPKIRVTLRVDHPQRDLESGNSTSQRSMRFTESSASFTSTRHAKSSHAFRPHTWCSQIKQRVALQGRE